ncbi:hypothetical protein [Paraliomyxa miuraensis]|uniref:hypothetical protein n=1 Tax=Paraliomyxa miuraensis TaxID=376150 RepID=UPI0022518DF3|nr:hypothetical protein [Paraliomyxa miuraensis]MCX4247846.1 hypothetical protein [Paraliomyxa miuraensis]
MRPMPGDRPRASKVGWIAAVGLTLAAALGCGVTPDATIAEEFHERLRARPRGFVARPCPERAAKVERLAEMVYMGQDLRARIREYDTLPPPNLHDRMMQHPMLGEGDDYRCLLQDFHGVVPNAEPDFLDAQPLVGNLYVLVARVLASRGQVEEGWAHVLDALALHANWGGFGFEQQLSLTDVLRTTSALLDRHPPSPATLDRLIAGVEATRSEVGTICGAMRHDLLTLAMTGFRVHFGQREREAVAKRFGLDHAMRTWRSPWPGKLGRAEWGAWRDAYDAMVEGCTRRPLGLTIQAAAEPVVRLDGLHPPTGVRLRIVADRLNRVAVLVDAQITLLATLRALRLRAEHGRDPTTAELALDFGRRPLNPWDGRYYTFTVEGGALSVVRGPYRHDVPLPPPGRGAVESAP